MKNKRKDWIAFLIIVVASFSLSIFGCNNNEEAVQTEREIISIHKEWDKITVYYQFGRKRANYRQYLPTAFISTRFLARLLIESYEDGDARTKSFQVWLNPDDSVSHVRIADEFYGCTDMDQLTGEFIPVERNSKLCRDAEKVLNEWRVKLDVENHIKRAMEETPEIEPEEYMPPRT